MMTGKYIGGALLQRMLIFSVTLVTGASRIRPSCQKCGQPALQHLVTRHGICDGLCGFKRRAPTQRSLLGHLLSLSSTIVW